MEEVEERLHQLGDGASTRGRLDGFMIPPFNSRPPFMRLAGTNERQQQLDYPDGPEVDSA